MSTWPADRDLAVRFSHPANAAVIAFLERKYPRSAHGDLAEELLLLARQVPKAEVYCPDTSRYGYVALHTKGRVIFALAVGMSHLSFRLPFEHEAAVDDGGEPNQELKPGWYDFPVFGGDTKATRTRLGRWLRVAFDSADRKS